MDSVRTPIVWNKPKPRIYNYNQEITGRFYQVCYIVRKFFKKLFPLTFQPMLDYVDSKERQGVFFEKPTEKIHLPEPAELALMDHSKSEFRQSFNFL